MEAETQMRNSLAVFIAALKGKDKKPAGWYSVHELRALFRVLSFNAASTKAKQLADRGFMERQLIHTYSENGRHGLAYIYRPVKGYADPLAAQAAAQVEGIDVVPKGYISIRDYSNSYGLSIQAVHNMVQRHKLKPRLFRIAANIGCTKPAQHFRKADLNRLHKVAR